MSIIGTIYEDVTTDVVGKIGFWQWLVTFVTTVLMIPSLFNQYEDIFMLHPSDVLCIPPQRAQVFNSSMCFVTIATNGTSEAKCSKWHVRLMWLIWLKKSWLVFCDEKLKLLSTAMICRFGLMFGSIIFGLVSDSFGRKTAITIDLFASLCLGLVITFCDAESWFRLFVFLKSLFGSANFYMGLILICEVSSNNWRSTLNMIVMSPRLLAMVCTVPLANAASNLETCSFIACLCGIIFIALLRWCPESPQWLLYNRKIQYAERILKNASKMNGIHLCSDFKIRPVNHRAYTCLDETTTCVGVLTTSNIRTIFVVTSTFWALHQFIWSSLYVRVYSEEPMDNHLLKVLSFFGLFSCLSVLASRKLTLRHLLLVHIITTGAMSCSVVFFVKGLARIMVSSIAISAGIIVHALLLNMTPRLFAINIRGTVVGCCHATGQLGSTVSYLIFLFHPMNDITFLVMVTAGTVALTGLCIVLPHVDGRELPDVMEDMDYYSELSKPLRWVAQKISSPSVEEVEMRVYSFGSGRAVSTRSHSETRVPARSIGFLKLWGTIIQYFRSK